MPIHVGSVVRGTLPGSFRRRALIASIDDASNDTENKNLCLIWEDEAPKAIGGTFLVTPTIHDEEEESPLEESVVPVSSVSELFDFEKELPLTKGDSTIGDSTTLKTVEYWKECGDKLLRERDPGAAASFYEQALKQTSKIHVGSTVLVQHSSKEGASSIKSADVDCLNEDESTLDISMEDDGSESTVPMNHVRLSLDPKQSELQERILLNLSRCLLLLAEQCSSSRRSVYLQSARLGCSLALAIPSPVKAESSLLLRSKAYLASNKFSQALSDVRALLSKDPKHHEGVKLLQEIERQKLTLAKTNKRLAKNVSRWVQTAMNHNPPNAVSSSLQIEPAQHENTPKVPWMSLIIAVLVALVLQRILVEEK